MTNVWISKAVAIIKQKISSEATKRFVISHCKVIEEIESASNIIWKQNWACGQWRAVLEALGLEENYCIYWTFHMPYVPSISMHLPLEKRRRPLNSLNKNSTVKWAPNRLTASYSFRGITILILQGSRIKKVI